jgi:hypothetical protein
MLPVAIVAGEVAPLQVGYHVHLPFLVQSCSDGGAVITVVIAMWMIQIYRHYGVWAKGEAEENTPVISKARGHEKRRTHIGEDAVSAPLSVQFHVSQNLYGYGRMK